MSKEQVYLMLDYETRSEADLKLVGAYEYARHPSTEILCVAWRVGTRAQLPKKPTVEWNIKSNEGRAFNLVMGVDLANLIYNPDIIIVAHNAFFEQCITEFVLPRHL